MSEVLEEVQNLLARSYENSIRESDQKLRSLAADIELHEAEIDSLKQEFAAVAQKRKADDEGLQELNKRMRMQAATATVVNQLKSLTLNELKMSLKSFVAADKFNKSLQPISRDFQHRVAAYRRQLQLRPGETGEICHLRRLMWQFLFVKSWYAEHVRLGVNSNSKYYIH